ncbi:MAG: hypothetical protein M1608_13700 [Candidatus Omnitrophica bacterium]|nr:hypothetical protein [Candidatus Omnitrophota bacterium]
MLELLLVTPITERQIISGRLRGIWSQLVPSVLIYNCLMRWGGIMSGTNPVAVTVPVAAFIMGGIQLVSALGAVALLYRDLKRRRFMYKL